jgi:regulator of replication initiation timing
MIKEVLQSNLQLREDLLRLQQELERLQGNNFQLTVENEDLRDRVFLLARDKACEIEQQ